MQILYTPSGRAGEYSDKGLACNPFKGCVHGCRYCYCPAICRMRREDFHASSAPVKDVLKRIEKDCKKKHGEPIFFSFLTDLYQPIPELAEVRREIIRIVKGSGNNLRILTKGYIPTEEIMMLTADDEVAVTLTLHHASDRRLWEPEAQSYIVRKSNIDFAHAVGVKTWASFEPVIDPMQTLWMIEDSAPSLDVIKVGKANHLNSWNWPSDQWRKRVESIDWAEFAHNAVDLLERLGKTYLIKQDLKAHLEGK